MPSFVCPSCRKKIHPPDHLAGRRVMCPRCDTPIVVPAELVKAVEEASAREPISSEEEVPFPLAARLGIIALVLGTISIAILCVPILGYVSIGLSSIGLLLGLGGLCVSWWSSAPLPPAIAGGVGIWGGFGTRTRDYPVAGVLACLFALILALSPVLYQWWVER